MGKQGSAAAAPSPAPVPLSPHSLASRNLPLASWAADKARSIWPILLRAEREELVGEAVVGLVKAANRFDPSRGFRFTTYATRSILNRLGDVAERMGRARSGTGRVVRFSEMRGASTSVNAYKGAEPAGWQEQGAESDLAAALMAREALEGMEPRGREVAALHAMDGLGFREVGERLGITRQAAQQAWVRARRKARAKGGEP